MRQRRRKGAVELLAAHPEIVLAGATPVSWLTAFEENQPLALEIGCGKGDFIVGMAQRHPERNFIGMEIQESVISYALDKVLAAGLSNVRLLHADGQRLLEYFPEHSVSALYLNFSDPWPKKRHAKRRLTSDSFLSNYEKILSADALLAFKTDNLGLFEFSLLSMNAYGMRFDSLSLNLHKNTELMADNIETEYERKFSKKGPIYRVVARFNSL